MDIIIKQLKNRKMQIEKALETARRRLKKAPPEILFIKKIRGIARYYKYIPGKGHKEHYIGTANLKEVVKLADKRYCEKACGILEQELAAIDQFIESYKPERKYALIDEFPEELCKELTPLFLSCEERCRIWQDSEFETNPYEFKADSDIRTAKSERVRSRGECIIADAIGRHDLPYHYEQKLELNLGFIYPDFTIMHPKSCELYYLEYFGLTDDPVYAKRAYEKIEMYQRAGLGPYLISLFDSSAAPLKSATIEAVLKSYFGV